MADHVIYYGFHKEPVSKEDILEEIPEGWSAIVSKLIDDLFEAGWEGELFQIKEKFGALRFYADGLTKAHQDIIDKAEQETGRVCIQCGVPATQTSGGWVHYTCDEHANQ